MQNDYSNWHYHICTSNIDIDILVIFNFESIRPLKLYYKLFGYILKLKKNNYN